MNSSRPYQDNSDQSKSIEDLERIVWPSSPLTSHVAQTSFDRRRKPLRDLTDEDLRLGLEQQIGVDYLAPLAVEWLKVDPLIEARIYPGDLLQSLLALPASYWQRHPRIRDEAATLASAGFALARECSNRWQNGMLPPRAWIRPNEGKAPPNG
jgi:hypothetical protein